MEVLLFTGPNCAPCANLKPLVLGLQRRHKFSLRVIEASPQTQREFMDNGIRSVPTMIVRDPNSDNVSVHRGYQSLAQLEDIFRRMGVIPL